MDYSLFDVAVSAILLLVGFILRQVIWGNIKTLQKENHELHERIAILDKVVAGEYVKRTEFERAIEKFDDKMDDFGDKLTQLIEKLAGKQDR